MVRNYETASPDRYELLKDFAQKNRAHQTDAEAFLWKQIKGCALGVKFKRQHVIYDYIADFVCLEKRLVVEVDGAYHFTSEQMEWDAYRTMDLEKVGFKVIRFTNEEVLFHIDETLHRLKEILDSI